MTLTRKFDRLAARGYFEISPTTMPVRTYPNPDGPGTCTEYGPAFAVVWAPTGQAGPTGGRHRFNLFCTRSAVARTIEEAVDEMLAATEPWRCDIDSLAAYRETA